MKTALVTGTSSGIGLEIARALKSEDWHVVGTVRKSPEANEIQVDMTDPNLELKVAGAYDLVVNNAGMCIWGPLEVIRTAEIRDQLEVNAIAPLRVVQATLPAMRARRSGHIINICSTVQAKLGSGPYAMSKAALRAMTETLREEVRPWNVEVSSISPGPTASNYARNREVSWGSKLDIYLDAHDVRVPSSTRDNERPASLVADAVLRLVEGGWGRDIRI